MDLTSRGGSELASSKQSFVFLCFFDQLPFIKIKKFPEETSIASERSCLDNGVSKSDKYFELFLISRGSLHRSRVIQHFQINFLMMNLVERVAHCRLFIDTESSLIEKILM